MTAWPSAAPLFVGADGERITRGTQQYRVQRYVTAAGAETRTAAAQNKLYGLLQQQR